jgi:hypothetical protein
LEAKARGKTFSLSVGQLPPHKEVIVSLKAACASLMKFTPDGLLFSLPTELFPGDKQKYAVNLDIAISMTDGIKDLKASYDGKAKPKVTKKSTGIR